MLNYKFFRIFSLTALLFIFSANYDLLFSQKFLALDIYKWAGAKRIHFYKGGEIRFRIRGSRKLFTHTIANINDSSLVFENGRELPIAEIDRVSINRSTFVSHGLSRFLFDIGAGFIVLDSFNNLLNGETTVKTQTIKEGIGLMAAGTLFRLLPIKRYRISSRRTLKIIDVSP